MDTFTEPDSKPGILAQAIRCDFALLAAELRALTVHINRLSTDTNCEFYQWIATWMSSRLMRWDDICNDDSQCGSAVICLPGVLMPANSAQRTGVRSVMTSCGELNVFQRADLAAMGIRPIIPPATDTWFVDNDSPDCDFMRANKFSNNILAKIRSHDMPLREQLHARVKQAEYLQMGSKRPYVNAACAALSELTFYHSRAWDTARASITRIDSRSIFDIYYETGQLQGQTFASAGELMELYDRLVAAGCTDLPVHAIHTTNTGIIGKRELWVGLTNTAATVGISVRTNDIGYRQLNGMWTRMKVPSLGAFLAQATDPSTEAAQMLLQMASACKKTA